MLVALVDVAPGGVGLPQLDELVRERATPRVEQAALHRHPLALRLAGVLQRQVGLDRGDIALTERRRPQLDRLGVDQLRVLGRMPQDARAVRREVVQRRPAPARRPPRGASCGGVVVDDLLRDLGLRQLVGRGEQVSGAAAVCSSTTEDENASWSARSDSTEVIGVSFDMDRWGSCHAPPFGMPRARAFPSNGSRVRVEHGQFDLGRLRHRSARARARDLHSDPDGADRRRDRPPRGPAGLERAPDRRRAGRRRAARARRRSAHPHRHAPLGARDPLVAGAAAAPGRDARDGAGAGARPRAHAAGDPGAGRGALPRAAQRAALRLERHAHRRAAAAARLVVGSRAARVRRPRPAGAHPRGAPAAAHARDDHRSRGAAPQARRGAGAGPRGRARLHRVRLDGRRRAGARRDGRGRRRPVGRAAPRRSGRAGPGRAARAASATSSGRSASAG